jgi:hypothetical protein
MSRVIRQAIITKYLGPTNYHCSRVKAKCQAGSVIVSWDSNLDINENYTAAATLLAQRLGWLMIEGKKFNLVGGAMPDNSGNCYIIVPS